MSTDPNTSTALAIASSADNVGEIVRNTPQSYTANKTSHDNCLAACQSLLSQIQQNGMTDELDQTAASIIEKTRRTVKKMVDQRSPVTKLFDKVRSEFTGLENDIDPSKLGTIPNQLQQLRNQYAAKKHAEEERRRSEEEAKRIAEQNRSEYRTACDEDYKSQFNNLVVEAINKLTDLNASVTLENYDAVHKSIEEFATELAADWCPPSAVRLPYGVTPEESRQIRQDILARLMEQFKEQYRYEIGDYRQRLLDTLPSKRVELERAAKASAEEKARIEAEIKAREAAELARKENERKLREAEDAKKAEVEKQTSQAANLFDMANIATPAYTPKTKVTKKIRIVKPVGYMKIVAMWWAKEGCKLSDEDLAKAFKKQITFCEKLANKEGEFIQDPSIAYIDDVKAQ